MSLYPTSEFRKKSYKASLDAVDARRRREDGLVQIRKRREETLTKRRFMNQSGNVCDPAEGEFKQLDISALMEGLRSHVPALQLQAASQIQKAMATDPPADDLIKAGIIPYIVEFLSREDLPQLQYQAACVVTNIACGTSEHVEALFTSNVVLKIVQLLQSVHVEVREQAVWAIGNIVADSCLYRDLVLTTYGLLPILNQINDQSGLSMLRIVAWVLSIFFRSKPLPPFEQIKLVLPALKHLLGIDDNEVITEACWALYNISDVTTPSDEIQAIVDAGICQGLINLLLHQSSSVLLPVVRTLGNIVGGVSSHIQVLISNGLLPYLLQHIIFNKDKDITKEVCWIVSSIAAGKREFIQVIFDAGIIQPTLLLLQNADFEIKKEAVLVLWNSLLGGCKDQIEFLVKEGCIESLCNVLTCRDTRTLIRSLQCLEKILEVGEAHKLWVGSRLMNPYAEVIELCGGLDKIQNLQEHGNNEIYKKSTILLEMCWSEEED